MSRFYMSTTNSNGNAVTASGGRDGQTVHERGWNAVEKQALGVLHATEAGPVWESFA